MYLLVILCIDLNLKRHSFVFVNFYYSKQRKLRPIHFIVGEGSLSLTPSSSTSSLEDSGTSETSLTLTVSHVLESMRVL